jgi:hypothetical protein
MKSRILQAKPYAMLCSPTGITIVPVLVVLLLIIAHKASAQNFRVGAGMTTQQFNQTRVAFGVSPFAAQGFASLVNSPAAANPYASLLANPYGLGNGAYSSPYGYGGYYYQDPAGAYLQGGAAVIKSQGEFMRNQMEAFALREQVREARTLNRRKALDEDLYERERTPTGEDESRRLRAEQVLHSRNNPAATEIWSGKALNELLGDLRKPANNPPPAQDFPLPLDEDAIKRINVTSAKSGVNVGLLKNEGRLSWPVALSGPGFAKERERLNTLAQKAVQQAQFNNQVDPGVIQQMRRDLDVVQKELRNQSSDLPSSVYIDAKGFVNRLDDTIKALQQPDIGNYINGKYALKYGADGVKGRTVPDLVKYMLDHGLTFAPADSGDEPAYLALHQALAAYDKASHAER